MRTSRLRVRYVSPALCPDGYGEFSRYILWSLSRAGHEVSLTTFLHNRAEPAHQFGPKGLLAESLIGKSLPAPDINIINSTPTSFREFRIDGTINAGFTMYEADRIEQGSVLACNAMDVIFVPSEMNRRTFEEHGVKVPIYVVNPAMSPAPEPTRSIADARPFTFYSVFEWCTPHKDPASLLKAYFTEFRFDEKVLLRIKTFERSAAGSIESFIHSLKRDLGLAKIPPLELVMGSLSTSDMWRSYGQADCYVSSHHGEGWGMPIWEAMASGLPTIATGYGANMEFMNDHNSFPVKYSFDHGHRWANVDIADLKRIMRLVFENHEIAVAVGNLGRAEILKKFTPERTISMIRKSLPRAQQKSAE